MKFQSGDKELNLPEEFMFGIELEAFNVDTKSLYYSKESIDTLIDLGYQPDTKEALSHKGGAECVSGKLKDSQETWRKLDEVCSHIKKYPGQYGDEVVADEKCGCHIHFDATDFLQNSKMMENLLKLWPEVEELVYKMCNEENQPLRSGAINQRLMPNINLGEPTLKNILSIKNIKQLSGLPMQIFNNAVHILIERRKGFASPSGEKIQKNIENDNLKVSYKKYGRLKNKILVGMKADPRRYNGLNLSNLSSRNKNTIEFRMSNGSLDANTIKKNIYLYASILNTVKNITNNPEYKKEECEQLKKSEITEEEKVDAMLNLIFDGQDDKDIYKRRWKSVKDALVFRKNSQKGFASNKFNRDDYEEVSKKVRLSKVKETMSMIKDSFIPKKEEKRYVR